MHCTTAAMFKIVRVFLALVATAAALQNGGETKYQRFEHLNVEPKFKFKDQLMRPRQADG